MVGHRRSTAGREPSPPAGASFDRTLPVGGSRRAPSIRGRLARILALPMVAIVVLLAVVVVGDVSDYRIARATTGSVALALRVQDLVQELQQERGLTSGLLGGDVGFRGEIDPERKRVDAQRIAVDQLAGDGAQGADAVRDALGQLDGLAKVRAGVDAGKAGRAATFQFFTDRIAALNGVDFGLDRSPDPALRRGVAALNALGDVKEQTTQERAFLNGAFSAGGFAKGEYVQFAGMHAALLAALAQYSRSATADQRGRLAAVRDTGAYSEAADFEQRALAAADGRLLQINPQSWWSALTTVIEGTRGVQESVGTDIQQRARQLQGSATRRLIILLALVLLCAAGAVALVVAASRSITRPLAALAAEAGALASHRLPEAVTRVQSMEEDDVPEPPPGVRVPARSSAEIRSVADALDRLQGTAYSLATEQALLRRNTTESLANLGRRNQNLLRRQLGFISRLEREETDPSGLANLFELDHLATRMRRNAESLLVLVGENSPRSWAAPLPVADVIRAAISEVEEYRRVSLRRIDDAYVTGGHVTGLAHMIAELVENGLAFSPPDVDVEIQGRQLGGQYLIAITDQGVGMGAEDLARANARLRGEENFLLSPTRFLGHYVVGHLARQMSADVQIAPSPVTGVTARVMLPDSVLVAPPALGAPDGTPPVATPARASQSMITTEIVMDSGYPARPAAAPTAPAGTHLAIGVRSPVVEFITLPDREPVDGAPEPAQPETRQPTAGPPVDDPDRTRNGLLKRVPRSRVNQAPARPADRADRPAAVDQSPDQLRSRLTSLRAGVQRGESHRPADEGDPHAGQGSSSTDIQGGTYER